MTDHIRNLPVKIQSVHVGNKHMVAGWKIYINGSKYPQKPLDTYTMIEADAIEAAIQDYKKKYGV